MKKQIELIQIESSQLHAIGHDGDSTLAIQFKDFKTKCAGSLYHYSNFSAEKFQLFMESESKGVFFKDNIKKNVEEHPYIKIEKDEIQEEGNHDGA